MTRFDERYKAYISERRKVEYGDVNGATLDGICEKLEGILCNVYIGEERREKRKAI